MLRVKINYKDRSWCLPTPQTESEWEILLEIFNDFGIALSTTEFDKQWTCLKVSSIGEDCLGRFKASLHHRYEEVSILEAIARLTTPEKSERDVKLEELSKTVADAQEQIRKLQEGDK